MGIGYIDSVVVYNRYPKGIHGATAYFGTRFDNVRVEFTQEEIRNKAGKDNASVCLLKIPNDGKLPKPYKDPAEWKALTADDIAENFTLNIGGDFFVIVKKKGLNLDVEAPAGKIEGGSADYNGNFFEYMKEHYGHVYSINSFAAPELIPRFEVGGR